MSHPPETSLELAKRVHAIAQVQSAEEVAALIDTWVLVREAGMVALVEKWRKDLPTEPFSMRPTDHVYTICADELEAALATARKRLEETP